MLLLTHTIMFTCFNEIFVQFLGVSLIWTFFSHVGAIFFKQPIGEFHVTFLLGYFHESTRQSSNDY
jgi:hypothetical protein